MITERIKRYHLLDSIRGFILLSMMIYHTVWDIVQLFGNDWRWYSGTAAYIWQQSICWGFIFLSGFCWRLGQKPLKRGLTIFLAGGLISAVTMLFMKEQQILFGILTLLGACSLLLIPLNRWLCKVPAYMGIGISAVIFLLTRNINSGYIGFETWNLFAVPSNLYRGWFMTFIGFPAPGFLSADYFSLFPWFFLFLTGYFTYCAFEKNGGLPQIFNYGFAPLNFFGRHSMLIYLLHQPVIYFCLIIILH